MTLKPASFTPVKIGLLPQKGNSFFKHQISDASCWVSGRVKKMAPIKSDTLYFDIIKIYTTDMQETVFSLTIFLPWSLFMRLNC